MNKRSIGASLSLCAALLLTLHGRVYAATQCHTSPEHQDNVTSAKWAPVLNKMKVAEKMFHSKPAYHTSPVPVRLKTIYSTHRMLMRAYPEKSLVGIQLWTGECEVIPQVERLSATIGGAYVFFNHSVEETFLRHSRVPRKTGEAGGFPEYEGWVVLTKDGRLPFIPKTLADVLDEEGQRRERRLAEWRSERAKQRSPDDATIRKTHDLLARTDREGARKYLAQMQAMQADLKHRNEVVYPATTARLEKELDDYRKYRASFSAQELSRPATWSDASGADKRELDARIANMKLLPPADQQNYDAWTRESRDLDRQARALDKTSKEQAAQLRAKSSELALRARELRKVHEERSVDPVLYAMSEYEIGHIKPGTSETAMAFKEDPTFLDANSTRIKLITVKVGFSEGSGTDLWMQRTRESIDWSILAGLLD
ncbi:MAG TPA: hypothetical protein VFU13_11680 [Steroidobacteraceae bacterium]|nr:hypothetical protein [Steroidobacteraceae bacterium]